MTKDSASLKTLKRLKQSVKRAADALAPQAIEAADAIWRYAEEPFQEFKSADMLRDILSANGFTCTKKFKDMPTAFVMGWGKGSPRIGILAEYDALPDCGLRKGTPGHGCGHNLLGAASCLAALAAQRVMRSHPELRGSVCVIGCPAEEALAGKAYLARDGAFRGFDAILAWHPSSSNTVSQMGGAAMDSMAFEFFGRTAHGSYPQQGRSALDAIALMDHAVNVLREHVPENVRMHSVITCGGSAPNVVPDYARSWYYVRGKDRKEVDQIVARVLKCARGAALATETRMKTTLLTAIYSRLPNEAMVRHLQGCFEVMGPPHFSRQDVKSVRALGCKGEIATTVGEVGKSAGRASSDEDTVSWLAPLGRISVVCSPKGVSGHHRDTTRIGISSFAHRGMVHAGKILALAALGLMADPKMLARAKSEFRKRTKGFRFDPIIPKGQRPPLRDQIPAGPT